MSQSCLLSLQGITSCIFLSMKSWWRQNALRAVSMKLPVNGYLGVGNLRTLRYGQSLRWDA